MNREQAKQRVRVERLNWYSARLAGAGARCALAFAVTAMATGCDMERFRLNQAKAPGDTPRVEPEIVIPVEAELPTRGDISAFYPSTTNVEAEHQVEVLTEGAGQVLMVGAEEGDTVARGQVLAELDKSEAEASLAQAKVQMEQHRQDYERTKNAYEQGLIPKAEYDAAYFTLRNSEENVRIQELQVANLTVRSPIEGIVTKRMIQRGQVCSQGTAAFYVVDPSSYVVKMDVPERELPRLRVGQQARVSIDALAGQEFVATLRRVNPAVDPATGTVKIVLDFAEEDKATIPASAYARVQLMMEVHEDVLLLPKDAILEENGRPYVYVVRRAPDEPATDAETADQEDALDDNRVLASPLDRDESDLPAPPPMLVERLDVVLGLEDSRYQEIVSGLEPDTLVVVNGQHSLKPDTKVRVTNASAELLANADLASGAALDAAKEDESRVGPNVRFGSRMR